MIKKNIIIFMICVLLCVFPGCNNDRIIINGITYNTYGFINKHTNKNPNIYYEVNVLYVIMGVLLIETLIVPIYIFGYNMYIPIGLKNEVNELMNGVINE